MFPQLVVLRRGRVHPGRIDGGFEHVFDRHRAGQTAVAGRAGDHHPLFPKLGQVGAVDRLQHLEHHPGFLLGRLVVGSKVEVGEIALADVAVIAANSERPGKAAHHLAQAGTVLAGVASGQRTVASDCGRGRRVWLKRLLKAAGTPGDGTAGAWFADSKPVSSEQLGAWVEDLDQVRGELRRLMTPVDLIVCPVMAMPAVKLGGYGDTYNEPHNITG